jgi:hypothetical protein
MREEFEKWAKSGSFNLKPSIAPGKYADICTQFAWAGWQAATALQAERVRELEEALQAVLECGSTSDQWWVDKARKALSATAQEVGDEIQKEAFI